jgi:hypothetical protein
MLRGAHNECKIVHGIDGDGLEVGSVAFRFRVAGISGTILEHASPDIEPSFVGSTPDPTVGPPVVVDVPLVTFIFDHLTRVLPAHKSYILAEILLSVAQNNIIKEE